MSKKQATLFQSWGNKSQVAQEKSIQPEVSDVHDDVIDLCGSFSDDDDELLCEAVESIPDLSKNDTSIFNGPSTSTDPGFEQQNVCDISVGAEGFPQTQMQSQSANIPGFDKSAGKLWIYPTNYPVRDYQFNIVKQALYKNTMVTLPTGLGKTFIAAVVMYNFYRWYPQGKIIFMAPTKPLVAQQIEACYNIMGIPQEHTAEMTGSMGPSKREKAWHDKRVFFLTPQVLTNDLSRGSCPAVDVKCLVIDEAHKALGNHAYCQVVRELIKYTQTFRVLSLSATPGSDIKAVQQVLNNLLISQIEIRTEDSIDIKRYSHERKVEKIVVPLGDELSKVKEKYIHIMDAVVTKLKRTGALYNRETTSLSKFLILKAREAFRQNPPERLPRNQYGVIEGDFALAMSLYHGYELLQLHGSRSLYTFLDGILTGEKGYGRTRTELMRNADFNELMKILAGKYRPSTSDTLSQAKAKPLVIGHPKMEKLQVIVLDHFKSYSVAGTRVMIFSQYRDSVQEITNMLDVHKPLVKVMSFIGQASSGKSTKGFTQKEQLKVMKEFREGGYNTLVSTCVGEEGLDIGDVDLIICFDAHKSPIRLVQRMGRTGRKREGRIVMLVTQGKEEQIYNQSQYSKKSIHKAILNGAKSLHFYQHCSRMVPESLNPVCHKMHITVKENFKPTKKLTSGKITHQGKINSLMNDISSKKAAPDEIITLDEYRELEPWLVPECEIPKLPVTDLCCLDKDSVQQQEADGKFFSLSEWSPWQTTLQDTKFVDHSMDAKHFVEIMEFVQLQQSLDPSDDPYGLEMAAYFNEEDVVHTDKNRRNSILNFCVTGQNPSTEKYTKKTKDQRSRVRRSDQLPNFDFLDDEVNERSDEDLPAFNMIGTDEEKKKSSEKQEKTKKRDEVVVLSDVGEIDENDDCGEIKRSPLSEKSVTINIKKQIESKVKLMEKKMVVDKTRKRKKSRYRSGHTSMISLIADDDSNDFEDNGKVVDVFYDEIQTVDNKDLENNVHDSMSELAGPNVDANNADEIDGHFTSVIQTETDIPSGFIRIRTPPHEEYAVELCEDIDKEIKTVDGSFIDLLALVDEWHNENKNGKYIIYPSNVPDFYTPNKNSDVKRKHHNGRKQSIPIENLYVTTHSKYSREVKTLDECEPRSESVEDNSIQRSNCSSSISKIVFKTPSPINQNSRKHEKVLKLCKKNLSSAIGSSAMDVDSDDEIMATGTFILAADDIFSDDEMDENMDQGVFDICDKSVEEVTVGDKKCEVGITKNNGNSGSPFAPVVNQEIANISGESVKYANEKIPFSTSAKFDSFFADDHDDDLFVDMKTPVVVNKPHETSTQITFTQAINFVHSSSHTPGSESCNEVGKLEDRRISSSSVADTEINSVAVGRNVEKVAKFSPDVKIIPHAVEDSSSLNDLNNTNSSDLSDMLEYNKTRKKLQKNQETEENSSKENINEMLSTKIDDKAFASTGVKIAASRKESTSSDDGLQLPEFDLDFDFDEDIIPPSPNNLVPSQTLASSRLSQAFSFSNRLSQSRCLSVENSIFEENDDIENKSNKKDDGIHKTSKTRKRLNLHEVTEENDYQNQIVEEESQSILGDVPVKKLALNKSKKRIHSNVDKYTLDTIEENVDKNVDNNEDLSDGDNLETKRKEGGKNTVTGSPTVNEEFESSFALIGEDFDEWIDSGALVHNKSRDNHKDEVVDKCDILSSSDTNVDLHLSNSEDEHKLGRPVKTGFSSKKSNAPVATISPFHSSQDFNLLKPSLKRNQDSKTGKGTDKNVRKSIFQIDDLSPDAFEDSFDFSCEMLDGKSTPKSSLKNHGGVIRGTSTPLFGPSKGVHNMTPFKVEDCTLDDTKQTSCLAPSSSTKFDYVTDNDDSFIVRRKKKVHILESPFSQRECHIDKSKESDRNSHSVSLHSNESLENDDNIDDSALLHKNDYFSKRPELIITSSSDEDFEQSKTNLNTKVVNSKPNESKKSKPVKTAVRKRSNPFLDEEAELSDEDDHDASTDEDEGSDQDVYEGSFIADSQGTQAMDNTDIHAVYLKSVKSPPHAARGGYKLQFNHRTDINVFSQVPEPENSEYMEDSFCVHSEEDDWLYGEGEELEETREITMMQNSALYSGRKKRRKGAFQTSRQRAIQTGRMKALDEIKAKLAGKSKRNERKPQTKSSSSDDSVVNKPAQKRSRIQLLDDSTSGEDCVKDIHAGTATPNVQSDKNQSTKKARFLMSSDDEDDDDFIVGRSMCASSKTKKVNEVRTHDFINETNNKVADAERMKMERLKRQREKQAEYKRKLAEKSLFERNASPTEGLTKMKERYKSVKTDEFHELESDVRAGTSSNVSVDKTASSRVNGKLVILVDSKEISGAQDIVSDLRFKYDIKVSAAQLPGCDFVLSNRMAVERKQWSEFSNGTNRSKLIERLQHLGELYDRPCLIVEKDRIKPGEEKSVRPVHWTKYIDRTVALLLRSDVNVLYSDSMTDTAELLADLCRLEERKNMGISAPVDLNESQLNLMKFFTSIPKLSYVHALNLCDGFKSLSEFFRSSAAVIEAKGKMSKNRALDVVSFIKRKFDSNMLPSHK